MYWTGLHLSPNHLWSFWDKAREKKRGFYFIVGIPRSQLAINLKFIIILLNWNATKIISFSLSLSVSLPLALSLFLSSSRDLALFVVRNELAIQTAFPHIKKQNHHIQMRLVMNDCISNFRITLKSIALAAPKINILLRK